MSNPFKKMHLTRGTLQVSGRTLAAHNAEVAAEHAAAAPPRAPAPLAAQAPPAATITPIPGPTDEDTSDDDDEATADDSTAPRSAPSFILASGDGIMTKEERLRELIKGGINMLLLSGMKPEKAFEFYREAVDLVAQEMGVLEGAEGGEGDVEGSSGAGEGVNAAPRADGNNTARENGDEDMEDPDA